MEQWIGEGLPQIQRLGTNELMDWKRFLKQVEGRKDFSSGYIPTFVGDGQDGTPEWCGDEI